MTWSYPTLRVILVATWIVGLCLLGDVFVFGSSKASALAPQSRTTHYCGNWGNAGLYPEDEKLLTSNREATVWMKAPGQAAVAVFLRDVHVGRGYEQGTQEWTRSWKSFDAACPGWPVPDWAKALRKFKRQRQERADQEKERQRLAQIQAEEYARKMKEKQQLEAQKAAAKKQWELDNHYCIHWGNAGLFPQDGTRLRNDANATLVLTLTNGRSLTVYLMDIASTTTYDKSSMESRRSWTSFKLMCPGWETPSWVAQRAEKDRKEAYERALKASQEKARAEKKRKWRLDILRKLPKHQRAYQRELGRKEPREAKLEQIEMSVHSLLTGGFYKEENQRLKRQFKSSLDNSNSISEALSRAMSSENAPVCPKGYFWNGGKTCLIETKNQSQGDGFGRFGGAEHIIGMGKFDTENQDLGSTIKFQPGLGRRRSSTTAALSLGSVKGLCHRSRVKSAITRSRVILRVRKCYDEALEIQYLPAASVEVNLSIETNGYRGKIKSLQLRGKDTLLSNHCMRRQLKRHLNRGLRSLRDDMGVASICQATFHLDLISRPRSAPPLR